MEGLKTCKNGGATSETYSDIAKLLTSISAKWHRVSVGGWQSPLSIARPSPWWVSAWACCVGIKAAILNLIRPGVDIGCKEADNYSCMQFHKLFLSVQSWQRLSVLSCLLLHAMHIILYYFVFQWHLEVVATFGSSCDLVQVGLCMHITSRLSL